MNALESVCASEFRDPNYIRLVSMYRVYSGYYIEQYGEEFAQSIANVRNAMDHMMRAIDAVSSNDDDRYGCTREDREDYIISMASDARKHLKRACIDLLDNMVFRSLEIYKFSRISIASEGVDMNRLDHEFDSLVEIQNNFRYDKDSTDRSLERDAIDMETMFDTVRRVNDLIAPCFERHPNKNLYVEETVSHIDFIPDSIVDGRVVDAYRFYKHAVIEYESRSIGSPFFAVQRAVYGFIELSVDDPESIRRLIDGFYTSILEIYEMTANECILNIGGILRGYSEEDAKEIDNYVLRKGRLLELKFNLEKSLSGDSNINSKLEMYGKGVSDAFAFMRDVESAVWALGGLHEERQRIRLKDLRLSKLSIFVSVVTFLIGILIGRLPC